MCATFWAAKRLVTTAVVLLLIYIAFRIAAAIWFTVSCLLASVIALLLIYAVVRITSKIRAATRG